MSENPGVSEIAPFAEIAGDPGAGLDVLALALAGEFRDVDASGAIASLDALGVVLSRAVAQTSETPDAVVIACRQVLGDANGFHGDQARYDDPDNSMLDLVLTRRRGLPILLSVVYVEVARRAGVELAGVGLPGHFVVGHFGADPPVLLDPFAGGAPVSAAGVSGDSDAALARTGDRDANAEQPCRGLRPARRPDQGAARGHDAVGTASRPAPAGNLAV